MKIKYSLAWLGVLSVLFLALAAAHGQSAVAPADSAPADLSAAPTPDTPAATSVSFLQLLVKGGIFMIPIAALSLLGLALIIERFLALRAAQVIPPGFLAGLKKVLRTPEDAAAGLRYCHEHPSPISRIIIQGLRKAPQGEAAIEDAIEDAGAMEVTKLRRNLRTLPDAGPGRLGLGPHSNVSKRSRQRLRPSGIFCHGHLRSPDRHAGRAFGGDCHGGVLLPLFGQN
jgi:hypothetical protein